MRFTPVQIGYDYDEPLFPWYDNAHKVSVAAGIARADQPPPTEWDPSTYYGCTPEQWFDALNAEVRKGEDGMYAWPLIPGVVKDAKRLYRAGHGIHILTARGQFGAHGDMIQDLTRRQLMVENFPYDSLHFVENKVEMALRLRLHYMIDDRLNHYHALIDAGVNCYLLDAPWNQEDEAVSFDWWAGKKVNKRLYSTHEYVAKILNRHGWQNGLTVKQQAHVKRTMVP